MALKLLGSLRSHQEVIVGIGTATPSAKLEVVGSGGTVLDIQRFSRAIIFRYR